MITPFDIFAAPREVFERIAEHPRWLFPAIFSVICLFVIVWLGASWYDIPGSLHWTKFLGPALISPLIVGIVVLGSTTLLYLVNLLLRGEITRSPRFKTMLSVNIHCGIILLLGEVVNFLLVRANLLGETNFPLPTRFPTGLDVLLLGSDEPSIYVAIILHGTSIFVIWYLLVLSLGIRIVTGSSRTRSFSIAGALWIATVMTALGVAYAAGGTTTIRLAM